MAESRTGNAGTQAEFEVFYSRTAKQLHGYLCRLSRNSAMADEVLQEAYIRMLDGRSISELDAFGRKAYLYRTATNLLRDRWRKQKVERQHWEKEPFSEPVHQNVSVALDVSSVFAQLCALDQALLWLGHVEQLSHREMAEILGLKEQSIKVILFRARARARVLFEQAGIWSGNT